MVDAKSFLFLGRHVGYPVAMEGALKLKEIAYTFTEGFAAGELKHGPIALVDEGEPVVFIVPPARGRNVLHAKVISGIEEVKARGAYIIAVAEETRSGRGTLRRRGVLASRLPDADEPAGGRGAAAAVRHGHGQA